MNRRIRTLKPEFFSDGKVCTLPVQTRFLMVGLISLADDEGRMRAEPVSVAAAVFGPELSREPLETLANVSRGLQELSRLGIVDLYEVDGERYAALRNWARHQRVDKPTRSRFPAPESASERPTATGREIVASDSRSFREEVATPPGLDLGSRIVGSGIVEGDAARARTPAHTPEPAHTREQDRKSTRLNSSH